jgi:hypothetical protein
VFKDETILLFFHLILFLIAVLREFKKFNFNLFSSSHKRAISDLISEIPVIKTSKSFKKLALDWISLILLNLFISQSVILFR